MSEQMASPPLVSVSVLNYLRLDALRRVLESVYAQDYPNFEVIVVDNASGPEVAAFLRGNFPQVRLIELPANQGTVARNYGIRAARGEIVVTIDNDVYLDSPRELWHVVNAFERRPAAGCVVFRIYHPQTGRLHARDWAHPRDWRSAEHEEFATHYLTEGAAAFRTAVFRHIEPYWEEFFIAHEGADLAFRLLDAGYEIWYAPEVKVWHMASLETRENGRPFYRNTRNMFLLVYRNLPAWDAIVFAAPRLAVLGFYSLKFGFFGRFLAGIADGLSITWKVRAVRQPIRKDAVRRIAELKRGQPGMVARFLRHWRKAEL
jgi:GT2 family glycosyltransferase